MAAISIDRCLDLFCRTDYFIDNDCAVNLLSSSKPNEQLVANVVDSFYPSELEHSIDSFGIFAVVKYEESVIDPLFDGPLQQTVMNDEESLISHNCVRGNCIRSMHYIMSSAVERKYSDSVLLCYYRNEDSLHFINDELKYSNVSWCVALQSLLKSELKCAKHPVLLNHCFNNYWYLSDAKPWHCRPDEVTLSDSIKWHSTNCHPKWESRYIRIEDVNDIDSITTESLLKSNHEKDRCYEIRRQRSRHPLGKVMRYIYFLCSPTDRKHITAFRFLCQYVTFAGGPPLSELVERRIRSSPFLMETIRNALKQTTANKVVETMKSNGRIVSRKMCFNAQRRRRNAH